MLCHLIWIAVVERQETRANSEKNMVIEEGSRC